MEMLVVSVPGHELAQPGAIARRGMAEPFLDPLVHEHAVEMGHLGSGAQQRDMLLGKDRVVDAAVVATNQGAQPGIFAVRRRPASSWLALEPDIGIEADLVAGMA